MYSVNQVKKILNDFQLYHGQLNSFVFGEVQNMEDLKNFQYPLMWARLTPGASRIVGRQVQVAFEVYMMDQVLLDDSNKDEIISDMLLVQADLMAELGNPDYDDLFTVTPDASLDDFYERFDGYLAGWKMNLTVNIPYDRDRCAIPSVITLLTNADENINTNSDLNISL